MLLERDPDVASRTEDRRRDPRLAVDGHRRAEDGRDPARRAGPPHRIEPRVSPLDPRARRGGEQAKVVAGEEKLREDHEMRPLRRRAVHDRRGGAGVRLHVAGDGGCLREGEAKGESGHAVYLSERREARQRFVWRDSPRENVGRLLVTVHAVIMKRSVRVVTMGVDRRQVPRRLHQYLDCRRRSRVVPALVDANTAGVFRPSYGGRRSRETHCARSACADRRTDP